MRGAGCSSSYTLVGARLAYCLLHGDGAGPLYAALHLSMQHRIVFGTALRSDHVMAWLPRHKLLHCWKSSLPAVLGSVAHDSLHVTRAGAFNTTTGPLHWELLLRGRAVDNQLFVAACSPARSDSASYKAWGHSTVVSPNGEVCPERHAG